MIFEYGAITLYGAPFQGASPNQTSSKCSPSRTILEFSPRNAPDVIPLQPPPFACAKNEFRLIPFRSPLLGE